MKVSMIALAIICLIGGALLIGQANNSFLGAATDVLLKGTGYIDIVIKKAAGGA